MVMLVLVMMQFVEFCIVAFWTLMRNIVTKLFNCLALKRNYISGILMFLLFSDLLGDVPHHCLSYGDWLSKATCYIPLVCLQSTCRATSKARVQKNAKIATQWNSGLLFCITYDIFLFIILLLIRNELAVPFIFIKKERALIYYFYLFAIRIVWKQLLCKVYH